MENHNDKLERFNINQKSAMISIFLCIFVDVLGYSMIIPLLPHIITNIFDAPEILVGFVIASNAGAAFIFAPIWGKLSDKFGRKRTLLISQIGTFCSFLLLGLSDSLPVIFASRILDGVFGGQIPIIRAYINDITEADSRSTKIGKLTGAMAFGMIFGPAIGGIAGDFNWRLPPFIACIISLISIVLTVKFVVESMPKERILEIKERKRQKALNNGGEKDRILNKVIILRLIQIFLMNFMIVLFITSFPYVIEVRYGLPFTFIGLFATFMGITMIIFGAGLMKPLKERFGEKKLLVLAIIFGILVSSLYPFMTEAWMLFLFMAPFVFSNVFSRTITQSTLSKAVDEDKQGIVSGWGTNMQSIGQIIAPIIAYSFLDLRILYFFGIIVDAYFYLGITSVFIILIFLVFVVIDIKKNSQDFT